MKKEEKYLEKLKEYLLTNCGEKGQNKGRPLRFLTRGLAASATRRGPGEYAEQDSGAKRKSSASMCPIWSL